ncbi:MAG: undecaprenyl/decaprenyl-phosphate alpha-N-acetylglucosaminyl 1-phosphate transferase [Verrucomicrobia bacterium]|nr:undecaprenyl/decaprenyl-phosphate alpha-N-acetylglucosaminyl 1-phosphate transferase [Verrucomicrobiota bacterium]
MLSGTIMAWAALCWICGILGALFLTPVIRSWAVRRNLLDRATRFHTSHTIAVPRLGGLALAISFAGVLVVIGGVALAVPLKLPDETMAMVGTCLAMFSLGFCDDIRSMGARTKLAIQMLIAGVAYFGGLRIGQWENPFTGTMHVLSLFDLPLTVFWLVAVTNLMNLVDGIDGLAAGLALLLMVVLSVVSGVAQNSFSFLLSVGMVGALLGFLVYNFPPAKIFMGDGGAYFLGMLIAEIALLNANKGAVAAALIAPFFALGLPIIDTSFTIIRRGLVGLPIFRADRRHIHHRLSAMGFSQRHVVLLLYAVCVFFALLALGVFISRGRLLPVIFGVFMLAAVWAARFFGFVEDWYKLGRLLTTSLIRRKHTKYALLLGQTLVMESENSRDIAEVWKNFGMMLQKLNFSRVTLRQGDEERCWNPVADPVSKDADRSVRQDIRGEMSGEMIFFCKPDKWDDEMLRLLGELAAESWSKAVTHWLRTHKVS